MLRQVTSTLTALALGGVMSVSAQQQAPNQSQKEPDKPAAEAATLTGCVQEAKTTDGATAYVLNKAQGGSAQMYVLLGQSSTELATHVNHKVEVKGQVQPPSAPSSDSAAKDPKVLRPPLMQVESVTKVADSCQ